VKNYSLNGPKGARFNITEYPANGARDPEVATNGGWLMVKMTFVPKAAIPYVGHLTVETDIGAIYNKFVLYGAAPEMLTTAPTDDDVGASQSAGVWDEQDREIIPAFPPGRPNPTHVHTAVVTEWENRLGKWPIPDDMQTAVDTSGRFGKLNPWELEETHKERMHGLLFLEEAQQVTNMRRFDLASVTFHAHMDRFVSLCSSFLFVFSSCPPFVLFLSLRLRVPIFYPTSLNRFDKSSLGPVSQAVVQNDKRTGSACSLLVSNQRRFDRLHMIRSLAHVGTGSACFLLVSNQHRFDRLHMILARAGTHRRRCIAWQWRDWRSVGRRS
jgi:hypothetical protein